MTDKQIYLLLKIVKRNGSVNELRRDGLSYIQIADLTALALKRGYLAYKANKIRVMKKGNDRIKIMDKRAMVTENYKWIAPEEKSRIAKMDINFVYLPNQDEIHF